MLMQLMLTEQAFEKRLRLQQAQADNVGALAKGTPERF